MKDKTLQHLENAPMFLVQKTAPLFYPYIYRLEMVRNDIYCHLLQNATVKMQQALFIGTVEAVGKESITIGTTFLHEEYSLFKINTSDFLELTQFEYQAEMKDDGKCLEFIGMVS